MSGNRCWTKPLRGNDAIKLIARPEVESIGLLLFISRAISFLDQHKPSRLIEATGLRVALEGPKVQASVCSRNDAIGNVAVMMAALGVWKTTTAWPDLIVAAIMVGLFLWSSAQILRQGWQEYAEPKSMVARSS